QLLGLLRRFTDPADGNLAHPPQPAVQRAPRDCVQRTDRGGLRDGLERRDGRELDAQPRVVEQLLDTLADARAVGSLEPTVERTEGDDGVAAGVLMDAPAGVL